MSSLTFTGANFVERVTHPGAASIFEFRFLYESEDHDVQQIEFRIQRRVTDSFDVAESLARARVGQIAQEITRLAKEGQE